MKGTRHAWVGWGQAVCVFTLKGLLAPSKRGSHLAVREHTARCPTVPVLGPLPRVCGSAAPLPPHALLLPSYKHSSGVCFCAP